MKDYRTWWNKGIEVGLAMETLETEKNLYPYLDIYEIGTGSEYSFYMEQVWAIDVGLAEYPKGFPRD